MFIYIYTQCHTCVYKQYISTAFTYSDVILEAHSFYTEITCKLCPLLEINNILTITQKRVISV